MKPKFANRFTITIMQFDYIRLVVNINGISMKTASIAYHSYLVTEI